MMLQYGDDIDTSDGLETPLSTREFDEGLL